MEEKRGKGEGEGKSGKREGRGRERRGRRREEGGRELRTYLTGGRKERIEGGRGKRWQVRNGERGRGGNTQVYGVPRGLALCNSHVAWTVAHIKMIRHASFAKTFKTESYTVSHMNVYHTHTHIRTYMCTYTYI